MIDFSFYPNAARAKALDTRMRAELARSLEYIVTQLESRLPDTEAGKYTGMLAPILSLLHSRRVSPATFASYYQLVLSLLDENTDIADKVVRLVAVAEPRDLLSFKELNAEGLGSQELVSLYRSCLDTDENFKFEFLSPQPDESARTRASVIRALALMKKIVPAMAAEFESLISEVILAAASKKPDAPRFDGGSSYMLWGALALSVDDEKSDLAMMETLAHEGAHCFLFGLTMEEPLVNNDDSDLYHSPLRQDPRPMDGIYHAAYVSARMHYAMSAAWNSGLLNDAQMQECATCLKASEQSFNNGYSVVADKGDLSATGHAIMDNACEYMRKHTSNSG